MLHNERCYFELIRVTILKSLKESFLTQSLNARATFSSVPCGKQAAFAACFHTYGVFANNNVPPFPHIDFK